jgi:hypothetical protein
MGKKLSFLVLIYLVPLQNSVVDSVFRPMKPMHGSRPLKNDYRSFVGFNRKARKFATPATVATIHPHSLKLMLHLQSPVELKRPKAQRERFIFAHDIRTGILSALPLAQLNKLHLIIGLA